MTTGATPARQQTTEAVRRRGEIQTSRCRMLNRRAGQRFWCHVTNRAPLFEQAKRSRESQYSHHSHAHQPAMGESHGYRLSSDAEGSSPRVRRGWGAAVARRRNRSDASVKKRRSRPACRPRRPQRARMARSSGHLAPVGRQQQRAEAEASPPAVSATPRRSSRVSSPFATFARGRPASPTPQRAGERR